MNKKRFFITFLISVILFSGLFLYIKNKDLFDESNASIEKDTLEPSNKDKIVFLLVGVDTYDVTESEGQRTDTIILVGVDFKTGDMNMLSIPRDTRVLKSNGYYDKINHAHAYGGIDLTLEAVSKLTNMNLEHYVKMDYRAVEEIVDTIGGVNIYVPQRMKYDDTTAGNEFHVDLYEGQQTLDGDQAIQFLRWRKNNDGTGYPEGDVGRVNAQQNFMKEIVKQSLTPSNIFKMPKFIGIYNNYIDTNIPLSTVFRGVWSSRKIDFDNINTSTIPGEGQYVNGISYFIYDVEGTEDLIWEMFGDY